jgi:hypothetical protein
MRLNNDRGDHGLSVAEGTVVDPNLHTSDRPYAHKERELQEVDDTVVHETRIIRRWKWLLVLTLTVSSLSVGMGAFMILSYEEQSNYTAAVRWMY